MTSTGTSHFAGEIMGRSAPIRHVLELITKAAHTDLPVLIVGETGTGKELVARQIHAESRRAHKPFIAVNTGALPREIVASELFGHRKGSFTGASSDKLGRFREADRGTLFLDEIGTMDDMVQVALLRALETEAFRPIGAAEDQHVDARLIAATNEDPWRLADSGAFRHDLLYRFEVMRIDLPPLRAIREDIPILVDHFVSRFSRQFEMEIEGIAPAALEALVSYDWPGNIRELKNVIAQASVVAERGEIDTQHLPARWRQSREEAWPDALSSKNGLSHIAFQNASRSQTVPHPTAVETNPHPPSFTEGVFMPLGVTLDDVEKAYAMKTLQACNYNKTKTAKLLGVSRKTLYDRLNRWGCR